jgi:GrpB-like predicted nucleotidyltransferase (UPF0157 family)
MSFPTKIVEVVPYDPRWPEQYQTVKAMVEPLLGPWLKTIEHVGSTSVLGLSGKPVIDVDCVVDRADFNQAVSALEANGFQNRGDLGILDRYAIAGPVLPFRYHLYLTFPDAQSYREHVALRDWLRTHVVDRDQYAALKIGLAKQHRYDIDGYIEGKSAFIDRILILTGVRPAKKE